MTASNVYRERWIGKPAKSCRVCGSPFFHINGMGGLVCTGCNPPRGESDCRLRLMAITIGGRIVDCGGHGAVTKKTASRIPWGNWWLRAIEAVEEHRESAARELVGELFAGADSQSQRHQQTVEGGKSVWSEVEVEEEYRRLAADKGESLDEFRDRKMGEF